MGMESRLEDGTSKNKTCKRGGVDPPINYWKRKVNTGPNCTKMLLMSGAGDGGWWVIKMRRVYTAQKIRGLIGDAGNVSRVIGAI